MLLHDKWYHVTILCSKNIVHCLFKKYLFTICLHRVCEDRRKVTAYAEETIPNYLLDDFQ